MERLQVALAERSYNILIGEQLLAGAGQVISQVLPGRRLIIVTDENVARLHLPTLESSLKGRHPYSCLVLPAGEGTKSFHVFERLLEDILALKPERSTVLLALGGGVIGDITGFAASVLLRGLEFIQVPTTLLSQVDSSVGGKTGINTAQGKNLVGSFHQPKIVLIDVSVLKTLPLREMRAGYAEAVKYGLINDAVFFAWLEKNGPAALQGNAEALQTLIRTCCAAKAAIVAQDEHEGGMRALLNLGHTFGHALEAETGFGAELLHGEAVAIGICMAFYFSAHCGYCSVQDATRVKAHFDAMGLPGLKDIRPSWDIDALVAHMMHDKKIKDGKLTFILARGIGRAYMDHTTDLAAVKQWLRTYINEEDAV